MKNFQNKLLYNNEKSTRKSIEWVICFSPMLLKKKKKKIKGKYFHSYRIPIAQILIKYLVLIKLCVYQVWRESDRNYEFYQVFKTFEESIWLQNNFPQNF